MKKIICAPAELLPEVLKDDISYYSMYSIPHRKDVGYFGSTLIQDIKRKGIQPTVEAWDFNTLALAVAAADNTISRRNSADGWTRQISLDIHLCNPRPWEVINRDIENALKFLTGDFWELNFFGGGLLPPNPKQVVKYDADCISLLSGGVDSLVGAIDLCADGRKPIFISQVVKGNAEVQRKYASELGFANNHLQLSHKIKRPKKEKELSTRSRSIVFFAFGLLVSSYIESEEIFVPENGFISLNIPLHQGRVGSFSTKTTHPVYFEKLQDIWNKVGIKAKLIMPYQFKTKGQMLLESKNSSLLNKLIFSSTSCGKFGRHARRHCGTCIPCLVRRAAFYHAKIKDNTHNGYVYGDLRDKDVSQRKDIKAMTVACQYIKKYGIDKFLGGSLAFSPDSQYDSYRNIVLKGFNEMEAFLNANGIKC